MTDLPAAEWPENPDARETTDADAAEPDSGDYSYDMAHEAISAGEAPREGSHEHHDVQVSTVTSDDEGDFGYDLAHEVRGS